jgi:hypothetical protein
MHHVFRGAAIAGLVLGAVTVKANAQTATFDFQDGTDQGFGTGFGNDASKSFPIVNIGGSLRMGVDRTGAFQEAARQTGTATDPMYLAMDAASVDESLYQISYDWYVDTSLGGYGTFLQLGTFVNTGNGYYAQNFPGAGKEVELNGAQLASGQVFSGNVTQTFAAKGFDLPLAQTFFRLGFITNGNGVAGANGTDRVFFDNVTVSPVPVPEPASLGLIALGLPALALRRRRV